MFMYIINISKEKLKHGEEDSKFGANPLSVRARELHREKPFPANAVTLLTVTMKDLE